MDNEKYLKNIPHPQPFPHKGKGAKIPPLHAMGRGLGGGDKCK